MTLARSERSMRVPPINWEAVFWLLCAAGLALAMWNYGQIASDVMD
jgi:hypothetical protein